MYWGFRFGFLLAVSGAVTALSCGIGPTPGRTTGDTGLGGAGGYHFNSPSAVTSVTSGSGGAGGCSADLQEIVDSLGNTTACPPDQGCYAGKCIDACDAAAQSRGSVGCDFRAPVSPFFGNGEGTAEDGPCYAVFVANDWSRPAKISIDRDGVTYDVTKLAKIPKGIGTATTYSSVPSTGVPANQVAVLFLAHKPGSKNFTSLECPVTPAFLGDAAVEDAGVGTSFHLSSDTPLTAYDILPYGGATSYLPSATLLYPTTAWGTNYYAMAPHSDGGGKLWMLVAASEDATTISVGSPTALVGNGTTVPNIAAGKVASLTLNAGEFAQWIDQGAQVGMDPSGAVVEGNKPIAVYTGSTYLRVATATSPSGGGKDAAHQELAPIQALGNEYVAAGVVTRLTSLMAESVPYRVMGVVDKTNLTYDPARPAGAPATLDAGEVAEFPSTTPFTITSQDAAHPFVFTEYMPGTNPQSRPGCGGPNPTNQTCGLGDEEWVSLVPPAQFSEHYVFFADPTYSTTNLVITRAKNEKGEFAEVTVACRGLVTGWMPVGAKGKYQIAYVDLSRGGAPVGSCNLSNHVASSVGPFGIVVWGTDYYSSYAYPAGGTIDAINNVVVVPTPQ